MCLHNTGHCKSVKNLFCHVHRQHVHLHVQISDFPTASRSALQKKQRVFVISLVSKMARLGEAARNQAIGMLVAGFTKAEVARRLNCHPTTISRLQRRYQHTGNVKDLPKSGRPRVTTRRQDVNIRVTHLRERFIPAAETARRIRTIHGYVNLSQSIRIASAKIFMANLNLTSVLAN